MVSGHPHGTVQPAHQLFRHLFGGRYKALMVDGSGSGYLKTVWWIAERLQMGVPGYVNHLLYLRRKAKGK